MGQSKRKQCLLLCLKETNKLSFFAVRNHFQIETLNVWFSPFLLTFVNIFFQPELEIVYVLQNDNLIIKLDIHSCDDYLDSVNRVSFIDAVSNVAKISITNSQVHFFENLKLVKSLNLRNLSSLNLKENIQSKMILQKIRKRQEGFLNINKKCEKISESIQFLKNVLNINTISSLPLVNIELAEKLPGHKIISLNIPKTENFNIFRNAENLSLKLKITYETDQDTFVCKIIQLKFPCWISVSQDFSNVKNISIIMNSKRIVSYIPLSYIM